MRRVGRPETIDKSVLKEILLKYRKEIIKEDFRVISKSDSIWIKISSELCNIMTANALYTFVTCNKFGIRDMLCDRSRTPVQYESNIEIENRDGKENKDESINNTKTSMSDSTLNQSSMCLSNADGVSTFTISIPKEDFTSLIIYKKYRRTEKKRPVSTREYTILQPGLWQHFFVEKIW